MRLLSNRTIRKQPHNENHFEYCKKDSKARACIKFDELCKGNSA